MSNQALALGGSDVANDAMDEAPDRTVLGDVAAAERVIPTGSGFYIDAVPANSDRSPFTVSQISSARCSACGSQLLHLLPRPPRTAAILDRSYTA